MKVASFSVFSSICLVLASLSNGRSFTLSGEEKPLRDVCDHMCVCEEAERSIKATPTESWAPGVPGGPVTEVMDDVFTVG